MLRKAIVAIMMILLIAGISVLAFEMKERTISRASSNVWYVGPPPSDFSTIQEAVYNESVVNGDTLEVKWTITPYNESVYVNKTLTIKHYSYDHLGDFPTVSGFLINASNVEINGFIVLSGIDLYSSNNRILNNTASVYIRKQSCNNTLSQNIMHDFEIESAIHPETYYISARANDTYHFVQYIDTSNTINGRPIYYLLNQSDRTIPTDAGFAAIVDSRNINATNLSPESSSQGVLVVDSTNVTIANVSLKRHSDGIFVLNSSKITVRDFRCQAPTTYLDRGVFFGYVSDSQLKNVIFDLDTGNSSFPEICLSYCQNNTIEHNTLFSTIGNFLGPPIYLGNSDNNVIRDNIIENSGSVDGVSGIGLIDSVGNTLTGNSIDRTTFALGIQWSNNSLVFHNNFLRNEHQVFMTYPVGVNDSFDNGFEGNYWSDYDFAGQDPDGDGIGNAPYSTDYVTDRYPLMVPWSENRTYERPMEKRPSDSKWVQKLYTLSNSTLGLPPAGFAFNRTLGQITMKVTCGYSGFLNITIPRSWIDSQFRITMDQAQISYAITQNSNYSTLCITYGVGKHTLKISGEELGSIKGDLNGDGSVDIYDAIILAANFDTWENKEL